MTIEAKLIRDTEVRTTDVMLGEATGEVRTRIHVTRTVRLSLDGAPVMLTGHEITRRYRPHLLVLKFMDGQLAVFQTHGTGIKKDGTTGRALWDDTFYAHGERRFFKRHGDAPAEIMDIVRRYAA